MKRETRSGKLAVGGVAAIVAAAAIAYTVVASREALREAPTEKEIAQARLRPDDRGYFTSVNPNRRRAVHPPPAAGCAPEALEHVRRAADAMSDGALHPEAAPLLQRALDLDPSCVPAGRLLVQLRGETALQVLERGFVTKADAAPGDAAAQLLAAYYVRETGDAAAYRKYLERASAANPDLPLLHTAWSWYWGAFANPRSVPDQLRELEAEVRTSGDPGSIAGLAWELWKLGDDDGALAWCRRYYQDLPDTRDYGLAYVCAESAIRAGAAEERGYVERALAARTADVSEACRHANLSHSYFQACRAEEALAEADRAIAGGCTVPATRPRRSALLALGRYAEAAAPPPENRYWGSDDRMLRGLALALSGATAEALAVTEDDSGRDDAGTRVAGTGAAVFPRRGVHLLHALLEAGVPRDQLAAATRCVPRPGEAARLSRSASGYAGVLALDEARRRVDRALALDPREANAWVANVYLLSLEGKLEEAAREGERAIAMGVEDGQLYGNVGFVHQQRGDCERAVVMYELARARMPLRESVYGNLATCLDRLGRDDEAKAVWRFVPEGAPAGRAWPLLAGLVVGVVALYLGVKLALIRLLPERFGHLRFP